MKTARQNATILLALGVVVVMSRSVAAQNAVGDGRALDANLNAQGTGINPVGRQDNFRARNDIITNNVVGGRGFRGSVGYTAANDFRGLTGSDDLFQFRADSAWSDVSFINYGNTYQRIRFGQEMGLVEYSRASEAASMRTVGHGRYQPSRLDDAEIRLDRLTALSSLNAATERVGEPLSIGYARDEEGQAYSISVSSLRGIESTPLEREGQLLGLTSLDAARLREDMIAGRDVSALGQVFDNRLEDLKLTGTAQEPAVEQDRIDPTAPQPETMVVRETQYEQILKKIAERYAEEEPDVLPEDRMMAELQADLDRLRAWLKGGEEEPQEPDPGDPGATGDPTTEEDEGPVYPPIEPGRIGMVLRHGQRVDQLASRDQTRFNELLASGEEALRQGEYFRAERRFARALRFTPGHPMATAGLAHAQLGAGLYVAASLTVRGLFTFQPEMIDTRYHPGLVPDATRLDRAVSTLRSRTAQSARAGDGLLLAYVGRLLGERPIIEEGVAALAEAAPEDPLLPLLRSIWLGQQEPVTPVPEK